MPGGSEDSEWTFTFLIEPFGLVVSPPLCNSQDDGRVIASEHSAGGAMLETCACVGVDAFSVAYA